VNAPALGTADRALLDHLRGQAARALLDHLRGQAARLPDPGHGWRYHCHEALALAFGRLFTPRPWDPTVPKGRPKDCFANALRLATADPTLVYAEGYAHVTALPAAAGSFSSREGLTRAQPGPGGDVARPVVVGVPRSASRADDGVLPRPGAAGATGMAAGAGVVGVHEDDSPSGSFRIGRRLPARTGQALR
jgi:hypothetical protein